MPKRPYPSSSPHGVITNKYNTHMTQVKYTEKVNKNVGYSDNRYLINDAV